MPTKPARAIVVEHKPETLLSPGGRFTVEVDGVVFARYWSREVAEIDADRYNAQAKKRGAF